MYDIAAMGELLIDFGFVSSQPGGYPVLAAQPGGAPANFLAAASARGLRTAMLGCVGGDAFGGLLRATLDGLGVDTRSLVSKDSVFTTLAFVTLSEGGERAFSFARKPGADTAYAPEDVDYSVIDVSRALHFGSLSFTDEPSRSAALSALDYARRAGKFITYDPNYRPPLWSGEAEAREWMLRGLEYAGTVKLSDSEARFLFGLGPAEAAAKVTGEFGAKLCFVTCGAAGCVYAGRGYSGSVPALSGLNCVDTTGAGDIFFGTAVAALLQNGGRDIGKDAARAAARFGCAAAGLSTQRPGGIASVPTEEELLAAISGY